MQTIARPIFQASIESDAATKLLAAVPIGGIATWQQLDAALGKDAKSYRGAIHTARKHLLNERQMVFAAVRGVGFKRLDDASIVQQEQTTAAKVRRAVHSSMKRLATVNPVNLDNESRLNHSIAAATLGAVALCVSTTAGNKVRQLAIGNGGSIDPASTLKLFA